MTLTTAEKLSAIKRWLVELEREDLKELGLIISMYVKEAPAPKEVTADMELLYTSIESEFKVRYSQTIMPWTLFVGRASETMVRLEKASQVATSWLQRVIPKHTLNRSQKTRLYGIFTDLVVGELEERSVTATTDTVLTFYLRLPSIVDKAFPGYVKSGLVPTILLWS